MGKRSKDIGYGFCPICGKPGVGCERSPNGNTFCEDGHRYPHSQRVIPQKGFPEKAPPEKELWTIKVWVSRPDKNHCAYEIEGSGVTQVVPKAIMERARVKK